MSSSYRGGGHSTAHSGTADNEAMQRVRYMSHMERRARPPTFRPLTIVVVVLSIGLFVIGLIMIVIAHWPGVSGGDSLKIAGGVLMAVGGLVFIIAMVVTCVLRNREQERFEKSIASIAASRSVLNLDPGVARSMASIHGSHIEMSQMRSQRSRASTLASLNDRDRDTRTPFMEDHQYR